MTDQPITKAQLDMLEKHLDKAFAKLGIDVEFTRHFLDRVNDERNIRQIGLKELAELFKKEYIKWGKKIAGMDHGDNAVMTDLSTDINVPIAIDDNGREKQLVTKTVMRKKNFIIPSSSSKLPVESVEEMDQPPLSVKTPSPEEVAKKHGVPLDDILDQLDMGVEVEREHTDSDDVAHEIALDHLAELPDYYTRLADMEGSDATYESVYAAWENYQLSEKIMDPRTAIVLKALKAFDNEIEADGGRQSLSGVAFDVARRFDIGLSARQLLTIWEKWKDTGMITTEEWIAEALRECLKPYTDEEE